jgi:hypothetical protein
MRSRSPYNRPQRTQRGSRGIDRLMLDLCNRRGWVVSTTPRPPFPPYPFYRRLGGPHGRSGLVRKMSSPLGFDLRRVQHIASRCTNWATRPTGNIMTAYEKPTDWTKCSIIFWTVRSCVTFPPALSKTPNFTLKPSLSIPLCWQHLFVLFVSTTFVLPFV